MFKKLLSLAALISTVLIANSAMAGDVFQIFTDKAADSFQGVRTIIFVVGGFGLIAVAVMAIFGKVNWKWFASLLIGLAIVAGAGMVIDYAVTSNSAGSGTSWDSGITNDTLS